MILRHRRVILVTRCHAEEHELARDLLLEEREVFSDADRWAQAHVVGTSHTPERGQHPLGQRRIVDGHGIGCPAADLHCGGAPAASA